MRERGPQLLSTDNLYLAPNQLINIISGESATVKGFIDTKGMPLAISVTSAPLAADIIELLYIEPEESYILENISNNWVVVGPNELPKEYRQIIRKQIRDTGNAHSPTVNTSSKTQIFDSPTVDIPLEPVKINPYKERITALRGNFKSNAARKGTNGDIEHIITNSDESFQVIALWYTSQIDNGARIARMNGRSVGTVLKSGEKINIPQYLVDHPYEMPVAAVPLIKGLTNHP